MEKPDLGKIPLSPGVYMFKNAQGRVLYVGKAKALRKRLSSYFREASALPLKTRSMLGKAEDLETISTATENEALLLEASLIKKHRPHYNILLRDDKEYLLFRLATDQDYPRLEIVRQVRRSRSRSKGGALVFGPYSSAHDARATWKSIHKIFPLRRCKDSSFKNRSRPCLYYHIGQCLAPCVLPVEPEKYAELTAKVAMLLQGRSRELIQNMEQEMDRAAEALEFERAAGIRDQIRAVKNTVEKQSVLLEKERDLDLVGLSECGGGLALSVLFVRGGALLGQRAFFWPGLGLEDAGELFASFLLQFYTQAEAIPPQIVLPWLPGAGVADDDSSELDMAALESLLASLRAGPVRIAAPKGEDEERLVSLAAANARESAIQNRGADLPAMLARVFMREEPVSRVEVVDVSHISGTSTRAGMVVFEDGRPVKDAWRNYAFESGHGDDYGVLAEWAERRINSGPPWPDLLLIDGGRGQLAVVHKVFAGHGLDGAFTIASIAKARDEAGHSDRRAGNVSDRIFLPGRTNPLNLKPGAPELLFLQHVRNHAHDFVLGRHRKARGNQALVGELSRVPGFGPSLVKELWERFDSLKAMSEADDADLAGVPGLGKKRIAALRAHLALVLDGKDG